MLLRRWSLAFLAVAAVGCIATEARAEPTEQCVLSATDADRLRRDPTQLRGAREKLLVCASDDCPNPIRTDCRQWLEELERTIPTVVLVAEDASGAPLVGARVEVDGVELERSLDGLPVRLDIGVHVFAFHHQGQTIERRLVLVARQKDEVVRVRFESGEAPVQTTGPAYVSPVATPPAKLEAPSREGKPALFFVGLGTSALGVVAIGVGSFFGLRALSKRDDANCPDNRCGPGSDPEDLRTAKSLGNASTALFLTGSILAVGGITLMVLGRSSQRAASPSAAFVRLLPLGAGLQLDVRAF